MLYLLYFSYEFTFNTKSLHPPIYLAMAAVTTTFSSPSTVDHSSLPSESDKDTMPDTSIHANGHAPSSGVRPSTPPVLRHVAAVHSKNRTSCLSHDSAEMPSFLGFRNLMVIVLSE